MFTTLILRNNLLSFTTAQEEKGKQVTDLASYYITASKVICSVLRRHSRTQHASQIDNRES